MLNPRNMYALGLRGLVTILIVLGVDEARLAGLAHGCGVSHRIGMNQPFVIGGHDAEPHEFPWMASLQIYTGRPARPWKHICGGTLIDEQWIVTAAHCLGRSFKYRIALGKHNITIDEPFQEIGSPERTIIHPRYDAANFHFDIGLIKLSTPLNFTVKKHLAPICLPSVDDFAAFDDELCIASGWGMTRFNRHVTADILQKIVVRILPLERCSIPFGRIDRSILCGLPVTRGKVYDGDSGGPLQCLRDGRYVLAGDVSFGSHNPYWQPSGYGRISEAIGWINMVRGNPA